MLQWQLPSSELLMQRIAMNHDHLQTLRRSHPAGRLLGADSAPLVAGFLQPLLY
jgi:hypothetical protein